MHAHIYTVIPTGLQANMYSPSLGSLVHSEHMHICLKKTYSTLRRSQLEETDFAWRLMKCKKTANIISEIVMITHVCAKKKIMLNVTISHDVFQAHSDILKYHLLFFLSNQWSKSQR